MIAPPPRWVRRVLLAPLVVALAVVMVPTALMLALVVGAALTWVLPGRLRLLRALWMAAFYVVWDAAALLALLGLWIASGCGLAARRPWYRRAHVRLARGMLAVFFWQVRWTLRLRIDVEIVDGDRSDGALVDAPLVVVSRHAGPGTRSSSSTGSSASPDAPPPSSSRTPSSGTRPSTCSCTGCRPRSSPPPHGVPRDVPAPVRRSTASPAT